MLTVGRAASHDLYYDKADDYYRGDARAAARWFGKGAGELGLLGRIESDDSRAAFAGSKELFGRQLGRTTGGTRASISYSACEVNIPQIQPPLGLRRALRPRVTVFLVRSRRPTGR